MNIQFLSNLPPVGESIPKVASEGGQLIADLIGSYGVFALCLLFVGAGLMIPVHIYEKYYKVVDDAPNAEAEVVKVQEGTPKAIGPAA